MGGDGRARTRHAAERILLEAARKYAITADRIDDATLEGLRRRYNLAMLDERSIAAIRANLADQSGRT